jgi:hypothetical protein
MNKEQVLINELVRLLCKGGGEAFVGNFQRERSVDGKPDDWTVNEISEAIDHVRYMNEYFGKDEACTMITSLAAKYNIDVTALTVTQVPADKLGMGGDRC